MQKFGFDFAAEWNPVTEVRRAGADHRDANTSCIALLIGVPVAASRFPDRDVPLWLSCAGTAIELLAAIPSIIYGMWGRSFCAPVRLLAAVAD
jgi:phosphate transport system permease protein